MKKLLNYRVLGMASSLLMLIATLNIQPACTGSMYQQKIPKCLKNN